MHGIETYDVVVVGVGGVGSAALYHAANQGATVLGLDKFDVPHSNGSSHGKTRIVRKAQYEQPVYVPLVRRAYAGWRELEGDADTDLLSLNGGLTIGPAGGDFIGSIRRSCEVHEIEHEVLAPDDVAELFPGYDIPQEHVAVFHPDAGYISPEKCIDAHVRLAQTKGADLQTGESVTGIHPSEEGVRVVTNGGRYRATSVIVTAGAWTAELFPEFESVLTPERQVIGRFSMDSLQNFSPERFPVFIHETDEGHYYGTPSPGSKDVKLGKFNHRGEVVETADRLKEPEAADARVLQRYIFNHLNGDTIGTHHLETCMFTNTPDGDFLVGEHPEHRNVLLGAGFSGHGYKFASAIGEALADLALDGTTDVPIDPFGLTRFDGL